MASRQTYYAESLGEDTTTSATYGDKATVTFTPDASSDYYIFWSCLVIGDSTSEDAYTRLYNSTDAVVLAEQNQEHRTTGGTPYRASHGIAKYTSGGSPASTSFKIQYRSEVGGTSTRIKEARVLVVKAHADDEYAEYLSAETTTSNSYVDTSCALTFTPATTGDYLIFSSADLKSSSSGDNYFLKLVDPASAAIGEMSCVNRDATNFNPWATMVRQNLTNSSKTFKLQWHRTAAGTLTLQNQRILALRLDTFDNEYYAEDRTRATTTNTSYVTDVTLTQTPQPVEHVIFAGALVDNSTTSVSTIYQFYEDSTGTGEFNHRANTGETSAGQRSLFVAYRKTLPAQSISWTYQHKVVSGATSGIDEDAIAVLQTARNNTGAVAATEEEDTAAISATVSSGTINNTLAQTEADDTSSAAAQVKITTSLASTEEDDSSAIAAKVAITTSIAATEEDDSTSISSQVKISASVAATEDEDTSAISAQVKISSSVAQTEEDDTCAAAASYTDRLSAAITEDDDTAVGAAAVLITASVAANENDDTAAASAAVEIISTLASTEEDDTSAINVSGTITASTTVAATEEDDAATIAAAVKISSSAAVTEDDDTCAATGSAKLTATVNATESDDSVVSSAFVRVTGSISATEDDDAAAISAAAKITTSAAATESDDSSAATTLVRVSATSTNTEDDDAVAATTTVLIAANCNATEEDDTSAAAMAVRLTASVSTTESDDSSACSVQVRVSLAATITEEDDSGAATVTQITSFTPAPWRTYEYPVGGRTHAVKAQKRIYTTPVGNRLYYRNGG